MREKEIYSFYRYVATVWDDLDKKSEKVAGLVYGKNLSDIGEKIQAYYGYDIIQISIYPLEETPVYEFKTQDEDPSLFTLKVEY